MALVEDQLVFQKQQFVQQPLYCHYPQRMAVSLRAVDLSSARDLELWRRSTACSEMRSSVLGSTPTKRQNIKFHFHLASKTKISSSSQLIYKLILNTCTHQPLYYGFVGLACFPQLLYFCVFGFYVSVQQFFRSQPFPVGFTLVSELSTSILKLGIFSER